MRDRLSGDEERFIGLLLRWDMRRRRVEEFLSRLALVLAGVVIALSALATLSHFNDNMVTHVLVPGFVIGILLVGTYLFCDQRVRERHRVALIIRKLEGDSSSAEGRASNELT